MFHMLSCFNLVDGTDIEAFRVSYGRFLEDMKDLELVETTGPIGRRESDTPMDTDDARDHQYFVLMSFKDRAQVDAAYAYIARHVEPGDTTHNAVLSKVADPVFICWQDLA